MLSTSIHLSMSELASYYVNHQVQVLKSNSTAFILVIMKSLVENSSFTGKLEFSSLH
jgi:hypothetical protein